MRGLRWREWVENRDRFSIPFPSRMPWKLLPNAANTTPLHPFLRLELNSWDNSNERALISAPDWLSAYILLYLALSACG
jgi:hypothetical protein